MAKRKTRATGTVWLEDPESGQQFDVHADEISRYTKRGCYQISGPTPAEDVDAEETEPENAGDDEKQPAKRGRKAADENKSAPVE